MGRPIELLLTSETWATSRSASAKPRSHRALAQRGAGGPKNGSSLAGLRLRHHHLERFKHRVIEWEAVPTPHRESPSSRFLWTNAPASSGFQSPPPRRQPAGAGTAPARPALFRKHGP